MEIEGITFGTSKGGTTQFKRPLKNSFTGSQKNHQPITIDEVVEAPPMQEIKEPVIESDWDQIRDSKPDDLFDEMDLGADTLHRLGKNSIAIRNKETGISRFFIFDGDKWINRFNAKQEL